MQTLLSDTFFIILVSHQVLYPLFFFFFNLGNIFLLRTLKKSYHQIFLFFIKNNEKNRFWKEQIHYILSIKLVIYLNICSVFVVVFRKNNYPIDLIRNEFQWSEWTLLMTCIYSSSRKKLPILIILFILSKWKGLWWLF